MIKAIAIAKKKNTYRLSKLRAQHPDWIFIAITTTAHSPLAPPLELLHRAKAGEIDWEEYEEQYSNFLFRSQAAQDELQRIAHLLNGNGNDDGPEVNVCLLCYEKNVDRCHRSIVAWALEQMTEWPWLEVPPSGYVPQIEPRPEPEPETLEAYL